MYSVNTKTNIYSYVLKVSNGVLWSVHRLKNNSLDSDWIEDFVRLLNSNERGFSVR